MNTSSESPQITAQLVAESDRMKMLPKYFGRYMMAAESMVYDFARMLVPTYDGGYWKFYELSNGGFYMAPDIEPATVCSDNGSTEVMSPDAIGITVCLYVYSHASFRFQSDPHETFARHYHMLREFASTHAESEAIVAAID